MLARELICEAITCKRLLQFSYKNHTRVVEPHIFGKDSAGHNILSAYLVRGYSESRKPPDWRFFRLSDIMLLRMLDDNFLGPRNGYNPGHPRMHKVYCGLERE
jgi:predicted DNA-binding transcriptional regulator YafY